MWGAHPLCSTVFMLKPKVGEIVLMSSPMNFLRMVVFPALSSPLVMNTQSRNSKDLSHLQLAC